MSELRALMIAPAPVVREGDGHVLDAKFIEGMKLQNTLWPGPFDCALRETTAAIPFGARRYDAARDGFNLIALSADAPISRELLAEYDVIFASADDDHALALPDIAAGLGIPMAATLEYTFETRVRITWLDPARSLLRKLYGIAKLARQELRRRRFMRRMDGLQANGYPAEELCRAIDPETLLFLDNRMTPELYATDAEMKQTATRLQDGAPLRLVFSGRLETMKGAQDLVPVATDLRARGIAFTLDIFGTGSLAPRIRDEIASQNLQDMVHLHAPVDFEAELVPHMRAKSDIFVCCHRQSDPSCSYIEAMGSGLAVVGYDNAMWRGLQTASAGGWQTPLGQPSALTDTLARLDAQRDEIIARRASALSFARRHDFQTGFAARMSHLEGIARRKAH